MFLDVFALVPFLLTGMIVVGLWKALGYLQRNAFKPLTESFELVSQVPEMSIIPEFHFGQMRFRNAAWAGEDGKSIVLKAWFVPPFRVPYSAFAEVKETKGSFQRPAILVKFGDANIPPLTFIFTDEQRKKFPNLMARISGASKPEVKGEAIPMFAKSRPAMAMTKERAMNIVGNTVRAVIVIILLIFLGAYLSSRYGL